MSNQFKTRTASLVKTIVSKSSVGQKYTENVGSNPTLCTIYAEVV